MLPEGFPFHQFIIIVNYIGIYGVFFEECVILGQCVGKIKTALQQNHVCGTSLAITLIFL